MPAVSTTLGGFLRRLKKAMAAESLAVLAERELVERFLSAHDEAAFQAILSRHGPMIFRVCRRVLSQEQDVEDAFQATFLVLAREAHKIRKQGSLASWLHGVAYRAALKARAGAARRRTCEARVQVPPPAAALPDEVSWKELRSLLDEELTRLPEKLRAPLVLCYLEGLTQDEAAEQLGCSKITCRRYLERARALLGSRLARRGVTLSAALFALVLSECAASAAVPPALAESTTEAAVALAAGKAVAALASARALALARGLVQPAVSAKVKAVCVVLLAAALAGLGGAAVRQDHDPVAPPPPAERQEVAKAPAIDPPVADKVDEPKSAKRIEFRHPLLILRADVQTELKLTQEQVRKVRDVVRDIDARANVNAAPVQPIQQIPVQPLPPGAPAEAANRLIAEKIKALREVLPELLTDAQAVRFRQLEKQVVGTGAFQEPENVKLLALTDEQQGKVKAIIAQAREVPQQRDGRVVDFDYMKADKAAVQQILELLTEDQRTTWRHLTGKEFDVGSLR
jgi:RNA polymerase sigma factor (sigma-70 family)